MLMKKRGFSLIELMVVILLIGIIATMGIPRFLRSPIPAAEVFISKLNVLINEAVEMAQKGGKPTRVFFNIGGRKVEAQDLRGKVFGKGIEIPSAVSIEDVMINGKSQFLAGGGEKRTVYFLIDPDGISQEVTLVLIDEKIRSGNRKGGEFAFYLNPFTSVFRLKR